MFHDGSKKVELKRLLQDHEILWPLYLLFGHILILQDLKQMFSRDIMKPTYHSWHERKTGDKETFFFFSNKIHLLVSYDLKIRMSVDADFFEF